ncbi:MAG: hypothetical protein ACRCV7_00035 [Culicoidibacterales bacterium]
MKATKVDLLNIEKNGFLAVLLNIEREFQRNFDDLISSREKFDDFCLQKTEKFIYPDGFREHVQMYIQTYLLHTENNKFQQIIDL